MNLRDAPLPADAVADLGASALLPRLHEADVRMNNLVYRRHEALRLPLPGPHGPRTALLRWRWRPEGGADTEHAARYRFRIGASAGMIGLTAAAESLLLAERQASCLPYELRCVLLADALADVTDSVQRATQQAFVWDLDAGDAPPARGAARALCFELALEHTPAHVVCGYVASDAEPLLQALSAALPDAAADGSAAWDALTLPLSFELGSTTLSLRELRSIERGDIVAVERWRAHGKAIEATPVLGGRHRLDVHALADGSHLTLQAWKELTMSSIPQAANRADTSPAVALERLDEIDVALRFEVGELSITLRELRGLQPGHVFDLSQPLNRSTVRIHAHGHLLGKGDLVAVGDRLGVRVVEFGADVDG